MKYLIAGLGNIGREYVDTRHNIGFMVLDYLAKKHDATFETGRHSFVTEIKTKGKTFTLVKPTTYMNLSGKAVKYWMDKEKIPMENILVVMDELALPLGTLRMRGSGSAGGHNGLKNIELILQSGNYPRLRFGIGADFPKGKQSDFVLGRWKPSELPIVKEKILSSVEMIESFAAQGIANTMSQYNK